MAQAKIIEYTIPSQLDLNFSYMPFIKDGGLFIMTKDAFTLGDQVNVNLTLPGQTKTIKIEGIVVWITPNHAVHEIAQGIGIQFAGAEAQAVNEQIKANLDNTMDIGGYTYGTLLE